MSYVIVHSIYEQYEGENYRAVKVYGNRHGEPFASEVNAKRSLTRRRKTARKQRGEDHTWDIWEISK